MVLRHTRTNKIQYMNPPLKKKIFKTTAYLIKVSVQETANQV